MSQNNFVIGVQTKISFGIMPGESLAADNLTAPPNVLATVNGAVTANAVQITVDALSGPIPAGTPLRFGVATVVDLTAGAAIGAVSLAVTALTAAIPAGSTINFLGFSVRTTANAASGATAISVEALPAALLTSDNGYYYGAGFQTVFTIAHAATAATAILVEPIKADIADGAVAVHRGLVLLVGGTTSEEQIQSKDTETVVYGEELPYSTGAVTGASWQVSYSFNVLPSDDGYFRLKYAAVNGLRGIRGWVKKADPIPAGYTVGESIQGLCDVTDFSVTNGADGIIQGKCTFKGRGKPTIGHYA